ncbi:MAG: adenylate/guanylate cyclase domain-containing protein [Alphaproteobacteria bacterium]
MNGGRSISLEVYVLKGGRWQIHANYDAMSRDQCLEDARELDVSRRFEGVCVVRETYNSEKNAALEAVIYHSPTMKSPPPVALVTEGAPVKPERKPAPAQKGGAPEGSWKKEKETGKPAAPAKSNANGEPATKSPPARAASGDASNLAEVLPKLAMVCIVALGGASIVSYLCSMLIKFMPTFGIEVSLGISQTVLISIFIVSFLFFFVPLMRRFVPAIQTGSAARALCAASPPMPKPDRFAAEGRMSDDADGYDDDAEASAAPEDAGDDAPYDVPVETENPPKPAGASAAAAASADMLMFIGDSLEPLAKAGHPLNAFNRFGLTLFFSGAGEYLASKQRVPEAEMQDILCTHMQMLGQTPDMARGFCANIGEYLINPKYFQMYEAGRSAIARQAQEPGNDLGVIEAVDKWNRPEAVTRKNDKEFVAVLFTDIVGSTAMTQERGDDLAQLVVREHNSIVRDALALHGGREIKHTGDGIMATFPQVAAAVEGAVAIQQGCQRANSANPELGLGICIGINAGEPIHEDGDIFGTPVQMAARVLSKAEGEEIAVSAIVRDLCSGKGFAFAKKGDYDLKGFDEPVPIFLMQWKGGMHAPGAVAGGEAA